MKILTRTITVLLFVSVVLALRAALYSPGIPTGSFAAQASAFAVVERGPHHRVWQQVTVRTNFLGQTIYRTNSFTEMATGLNVWDGSQWVEASDQIQITPNGASGTNSQHQVSFAANINTAGSIDLTMPDGRHLRSQLAGLAYFDQATSNSVMFAETKDCVGQLLSSSNQVVYTNAFTDFQADVRYTYLKSRFEQDVILRSQPPSAAQYGLNPQTTMMQIWTEFLDPPEPDISYKQITVNGEGNSQKLEDQKLDFGTMQAGNGIAFATDTELDRLAAVPVTKKWIHAQGRTFLVEQIPLNTVLQELQKLPPNPASNTNNSSGSGSPGASLRLKLPAPKVQAKANRPMQLAKGEVSKFRPGFLLDYNITVSTLTNWTFQSDTTYYISDILDLYETNTIEGGTVIKSGPTSGGTTFHDTLISLTAPYRPAVITATNDNSVGIALATNGSTPDLMITTMFSLADGGSITNFRICYAWNGLTAYGTNVDVSDCQFINCSHPITINADTTNLGLHNVLITMTNLLNNSTNFCSCQSGALTSYSQAATIYGENVTADLDSQYLIMYFTTLFNPSDTTVQFTNSILITPSLNAYYWTSLGGGTVGVTANTNNTDFYATSMPSGLFQTVGSAGYYLADDSPYRNAGTTNITSDLIYDLSQKTTYPPFIISVPGNFTSYPLTLFPQAQRDWDDAPDLGYHYDPIDYALNEVVLSNTTFTVTPGTVIAGYTTNDFEFALGVCYGSQFICQGAPNNLCRIINYNTVQEQSNTNWSTPYGQLLISDYDASSSFINCRFTDFSVMAKDTEHFYGDANTGGTMPDFQDCQFHGGILDDQISANYTNCLLERVDFTQKGSGCNIRNCLFYRGSIFLGLSFTGDVQDSMFDQVLITDRGSYTYGWNGFNYTNSTTNFLSLTNGTDVFLTNASYQTSWLGNYYLPPGSLLLNAGNTTANLLGLYEYTTQTNQTEQGDSVVDIGYHYVAVDSIGNPIDSNSDGVPDYVQDANGNGVVDSGEIDWLISGDLGLKIVITQPNDNTVVP